MILTEVELLKKQVRELQLVNEGYKQGAANPELLKPFAAQSGKPEHIVTMLSKCPEGDVIFGRSEPAKLDVTKLTHDEYLALRATAVGKAALGLKP